MKPKNPTWKKIDTKDGWEVWRRHRVHALTFSHPDGRGLIRCWKENMERVIHDFVAGEHVVSEYGDVAFIAVPAPEVSDG